MTNLVAVDLFCGSGGFSVGLQSAGFNVVSAYDNWPIAIETYQRNIGKHVYQLDLNDIDKSVKEICKFSPDIVVGGPPCQDFSTAGARKEGFRANLTISFGKIVERCRPPFIIMENVPRARLSKAYERMRDSLSQSAGYKFAECVLDASLYGVPQKRKRFFVFGWRGSKHDIGDRFLGYIAEKMSPTVLTVKNFMGSEIDVEHYYRHPRNYARRSVFSVHEPSPTIRGVNRPVPPNYDGNHLDSVHPSTVRPLTTWERSRIQTFPKSWEWGGADRNSAVELQIGNAVPVRLAEFVSNGVLRAIS